MAPFSRRRETLRAPDGDRLNSLDGLRLIGCYFVVLYHFVPYISGKDSLLFWPLRNTPVMVDMFFVMSGIVIANSYERKIVGLQSYGEFIQKRVARLYPLHFITLMFYVAIGLAGTLGLLRVARVDKYDFSELLPNLLMVHAWGFSDRLAFNYPSWSISAEFFVYICFPALLWIVSRSLRSAIAAIALLYVTCSLISELLLGRHLIAVTIPLSIIRALPSFALGVALYHYRDRLPQLRASTARRLLDVASASFLAMVVLIDNPHVLLAAACMITAVAFIADRDRVRTTLAAPILVRNAEFTYSMYMLHAAVATLFLAFIFPKTLGAAFDLTWVRAVCVVAAFGLTLLASAASYKLFEKPCRRFITSLRLFKTARSRHPTPAASDL